jgi:cell wall assembly regulator SMI1
VNRGLIAACVISAIVFLAVVLLWMNRDAILLSLLSVPTAEQAYPHAPPMPPAVSTPVEDLLAKYETFLKSKAPAVFAALQPGLSDAQIDALEATHGLKLTGDLRALYRWRNGTPRAANVFAFPDHRFVPLDDALTERTVLRKQVKGTTPLQQKAYARLTGYRDAWVGLIVDDAGDGHFFDPGRSEAQGSFFFCFAEDADYVFYPAFRNYLAGVVAGADAGVFTAGPLDVDTADFARAQQLWEQFGGAPRRTAGEGE